MLIAAVSATVDRVKGVNNQEIQAHPSLRDIPDDSKFALQSLYTSTNGAYHRHRACRRHFRPPPRPVSITPFFSNTAAFAAIAGATHP